MGGGCGREVKSIERMAWAMVGNLACLQEQENERILIAMGALHAGLKG